MTRRDVPMLLSALGLPAATISTPWTGFPHQDPSWVEQIVGAAHRDLAKVKALVGEHPALVNAVWDWGFGDWETPLGSASHVGNREIAEYLLSQGARIDIFAAAMLGMTDAVRALIEAQPGIEAARGPHGIPLLAHARAGGDRARGTVALLEKFAAAGRGIPTAKMEPGQRARFVGRYRISGWMGPDLEVKLSSPEQLSLVIGPNSRWIHPAGESSFYPAGAGQVRVQFTPGPEPPSSLTIVDGPSSVVATRVP